MQPTTPARRRGDVHLVGDVPLRAVPEEGPAEHLRTALALLVAHETAHPAVWTFSPELRACEGRLFRALFQIEGLESPRTCENLPPLVSLNPR